MMLPSFNAACSIFTSSSSYCLSAKKYAKGNHNVASQNNIISYYEGQPIFQSTSEPTESGRKTWSELERACDNLECSSCRRDCTSFINGLHDALNIKLGKPMKYPNDFIYLRNFINSMSIVGLGRGK
jgi:hypothetical protein